MDGSFTILAYILIPAIKHKTKEVYHVTDICIFNSRNADFGDDVVFDVVEQC
jgi:hypothetical protein